MACKIGTAKIRAPDCSEGERIGQHFRTRKCNITAYDWEQFPNLADDHLLTSGP